MSTFIVDASVVIGWLTGEPGSEAAIPLLERSLHAPDLLCAECSNALWKKVARKEISAMEAEGLATTLQLATITFHPARELLAAATRLACTLRHPAYDCFYLALAERLAMRLITADERLIRLLRARSHSELANLVVPLTALGDVL